MGWGRGLHTGLHRPRTLVGSRVGTTFLYLDRDALRRALPICTTPHMPRTRPACSGWGGPQQPVLLGSWDGATGQGTTRSRGQVGGLGEGKVRHGRWRGGSAHQSESLGARRHVVRQLLRWGVGFGGSHDTSPAKAEGAGGCQILPFRRSHAQSITPTRANSESCPA